MFFRNIAADYMRIYELAEGKSRIVRALYPLTCPGIYALLWFRLIKANRRYRIPILYYPIAFILRIMNSFHQVLFGICIASNCEIGPGLYIAHHGQIFVGVKSMGAHCTIGHSVTIGRTEKEHGYPTFGNNVYVAPGAVVIGKIEIGDNVKIGPNTVVRRSVPANSVVMALPPKVIRMTSKEECAGERESVERPAEKAAPGKPQRGVEKPPKPLPAATRRENRPVAPPVRQNANTQTSRDRKSEGDRYKSGHRNWRPKYRPAVEVKSDHVPKTDHKYDNRGQGTQRNPTPKQRDLAGRRSDNVVKKPIDDGKSPGGTTDRDKWAEDQEGESLDS